MTPLPLASLAVIASIGLAAATPAAQPGTPASAPSRAGVPIELETAIEAHRRMVAASPDDAVAHHNLAALLARSGERAGAAAAFARSDALARHRAPDVAASARHGLGALAFSEAHELSATAPEEAIESFRRAERFFRSALEVAPGELRSARAVEATQLEIQWLVEQLEQEQREQEQQHDRGDQNQDNQRGPNPDQQESDQPQQQPQGGQPPSDRNSSPRPDEGSEQPQTEHGERAQDGPPDQPNDRNAAPRDRASDEPSSQQQQNTRENVPTASQDPAPPSPPAAQPQPEPTRRSINLAAAQILEKERRDRERLARLRAALSGRPGPVDKDW